MASVEEREQDLHTQSHDEKKTKEQIMHRSNRVGTPTVEKPFKCDQSLINAPRTSAVAVVCTSISL